MKECCANCYVHHNVYSERWTIYITNTIHSQSEWWHKPKTQHQHSECFISQTPPWCNQHGHPRFNGGSQLDSAARESPKCQSHDHPWRGQYHPQQQQAIAGHDQDQHTSRVCPGLIETDSNEHHFERSPLLRRWRRSTRDLPNAGVSSAVVRSKSSDVFPGLVFPPETGTYDECCADAGSSVFWKDIAQVCRRHQGTA